MTPVNLTEIEEKDLLKEIARRKENWYRERVDERTKKTDFWLKNIDSILSLVPNHGKTSCSDEQPTNTRSCDRCRLLSFKNNGFWDFDYELYVGISKSIIVKEA